MDVKGDLIWGDDNESQVFAEARTHELCVIFRYALNPNSPHSLPSRIVTCFHDLEVQDSNQTFSDRAEMREAVYSLIREVWGQCSMHPSITAPDGTVEIYEDAQQQHQWRITHESLYNQYTASLLPVASFIQATKAKPRSFSTVDHSSLIPIEHLGGRGRTALVTWCEKPYVFKGVDFGTFLESPTDFKHQKDVCYHEIRTILSLPPHPNIITPSNIFVTASKIHDDQQACLCGALYPFMSQGTLDDQVENSKATGAQIPLMRKARWCFQMAAAIAHTHFAARTFHMDIKPANFLLDGEQNLILIDWEQSGAPSYTLAPEADGSWDVREVVVGSSSPRTTDYGTTNLVYEKYDGPDRENLAWGWPKWNVFPLWRDSYPRALHAAEVFSLGRTMWMLLNEVTQGEVEERDKIFVSWSQSADEVPQEWKGVVGRCLDPDPSERIGLVELAEFWKVVLCNDGFADRVNTAVVKD